MQLFIDRPDGNAVYTATAPDTVTTWVTSAFAVNPTSGLGLASELANVNICTFPLQFMIATPYDTLCVLLL